MRLLLMIPVCLGAVLSTGCTAEASDPRAAPSTTIEAAFDPHGRHHETPEVPAEAEAQATAAAFLQAYLDTDLAATDLQAWLAAMEPHTHGPYLEALSTINPNNLYTDTLVSDLVPAEVDRDDTAAFEASGTDGALWRIELYAGEGRWLVYAVSREAES